MSMMKEFKEFATKGNVVDLAVGVIIGAAFGKITASLVADVLMPPIGLVLGRVDFTNLFVALGDKHFDSLADAKKAGAATINYGVFVNTCIEFMIVAFAIFLVVKAANKPHKKAEAPVATKKCTYCQSDIPVAAIKCGHCTSNLEGKPA